MDIKFTVAVCEHTHEKVVQCCTGDEVLCLHHENVADDILEAESFESGQHLLYSKEGGMK